MLSFAGRRHTLRAAFGLAVAAVAGSFKSLFAATNPTTTQPIAPRVSPNETVVRNFIEEVWNRGDVASVKRYYSARSSCISREEPAQLLGRPPATYEEYVQTYRKAFPDLKVRILSMSEQGNVVTVRWTAEGSLQGDLPMIKATGRQATVSGTASYRVTEGKISAMTAQWSAEQVSKQLKAR